MRKIALISMLSILIISSAAVVGINISQAADADTDGGVIWTCTIPKLASEKYTTEAACLSACKDTSGAPGTCLKSIIVSPTYISKMLQKYTQWFVAIVGLLAVIFIIWGGLQYMLAKGDAVKGKTARKMILYALIGLAITLFAGGAMWTILNFFTPD